MDKKHTIFAIEPNTAEPFKPLGQRRARAMHELGFMDKSQSQQIVHPLALWQMIVSCCVL
jgi:hypothetical protein